MKSLLFLLFFGTTLICSAQQILPIQYDTNRIDYELIVSGYADFGATSVQNQFSSKFLYGGEITDEIKTSSFNLHKSVNRFGGDLSGAIEFRNMKSNFFGSDKWGYLIKAEHSNYISSIYSKEIFGLAFFGNEQYLGENMSFSGTRVSSFGFDKIGFGMIDKSSKTNASINLYSISNYSEAFIKEGDLFQSAEGDSVSLTLDGVFESATSSNYFKGFGMGIDFDIRIPVQLIEEKTSYFQFQVKNIGLAYLNSAVTRYSMDTVITYDGFTFDELIDENSVVNNDFSVLSKLGIDSTVVHKSKFLPGYIQFGKITDLLNPAKLQAFYGIKMYTINTYSPLIYIGGQYKVSKNIDLALNASYGGFSKFRTGLYTQFNFSKLWIGLGSEDIIGLVSKKGRGASLNLRVRCLF